MKIDRHGKAKVLSTDEIQRLFTSGLLSARDKTLCAVMLYTACRIKECVTLKIKDVYDSKGRVRPELIIRKSNTKGKLATRTIPVLDDLHRHLKQYKPPKTIDGYLFPGRWGRGYIHEDSAAVIFREACKRADIIGASSHSCRRTALTLMSNAGIPLRVIQEISGHRNLEQLQRYLEVEESQVRGAIAALSMLTPVDSDHALSPENVSGAERSSASLQTSSTRDDNTVKQKQGSSSGAAALTPHSLRGATPPRREMRLSRCKLDC